VGRPRTSHVQGNACIRNGEASRAELPAANLVLTDDVAEPSWADFPIVAAPKPIRTGTQPDLVPLREASETLGRVLKRGDIVPYESTVHPDVTEEFCVPILERESNLY
jgi:UDP-N-acetyl-D-galactosamine dehydrogenase